MTHAAWEHFEHKADIGVRGAGRTLGQAFEQTALAMTAIVSDPASVEAAKCVEITCEEPDVELLLVDWLNALVFEMATRKMLFSRFEVTIEGPHLRAKAWGEPVSLQRHDPAVEIKGATYTELKVERRNGDHWIAQCVVDV